MPDTTTRAQEIRAELNELAPFPAWGSPMTPLSVAKYLDVQAQILWEHHVRPFTGGVGESLDPKAIMQMNAQFAAAHTLRILARINPDAAQVCTAQIADAWNDGGGVGEWIWEHLGEDAARVAKLAQELAEATAVPTGPGTAVPGFTGGEFDAAIWARQFCKLVAERPDFPGDEGNMLTWFANAIMAGYDHAYEEVRRNNADKPGVVLDPADVQAVLTAKGPLPDALYDRLRAAAGMA